MNRAHSALLSALGDEQLLVEVKRLVARERLATVDLIASLAEVDARKLYLTEGHASLFSYCTSALGYSEDAAYSRITAARAAARFPSILERLARGSVTLTAVRLLAPHLTAENHREVLDAARGKSKREVEELLARLQPQPDVRPLVRKVPARAALFARPSESASFARPAQSGTCRSTTMDLPTALTAAGVVVAAGPTLPTSADDRGTAGGSMPAAGQSSGPLAGGDGAGHDTLISSAPRRGVMAPLAPGRYKVQFTVSAETRDRLRTVQDLLRHSVPDGDLATIFDRALIVLLEQLERTKWAATKGSGSKRRRTRRKEADAPPRVERRLTRSAAINEAARTTPGQAGADSRAEQPDLYVSDPQLVPEQVGSTDGPPNREMRATAGQADADSRREQPDLYVSDPQLVPEQVGMTDGSTEGGARKNRPTERSRGSKPSRRIPAGVKRAVWQRDGGQCRFVGNAQRCPERSRLEFHHLIPYADGGTATADNLELRCVRHHGLESERWFGTVRGPIDA